MGATLKELIAIDGVVATFEFGAGGALVDYASSMDMPKPLAEMTAQFSASVTQMFNTLSEAFSKISWMEWSPQIGWAYTGGKYTAVASATNCVFIRTNEGDFNRVFTALFGSG